MTHLPKRCGSSASTASKPSLIVEDAGLKIKRIGWFVVRYDKPGTAAACRAKRTADYSAAARTYLSGAVIMYRANAMAMIQATR
jgi:hypothetical protein